MQIISVPQNKIKKDLIQTKESKITFHNEKKEELKISKFQSSINNSGSNIINNINNKEIKENHEEKKEDNNNNIKDKKHKKKKIIIIK